MTSDEKILITGVTGSVAEPLARFLAAENDVWGLARFGDTDEAIRLSPKRVALEEAGVTTRPVDLGSGTFGDLPDNFTYVLHLAWNTGPAALEGAPVQVELQGNATLGVQMQGAATASADGSSTEFAATLGVVGGTGKYASATGTGIFTGSRQAALGATVAASFDLTIAGAG